MQQGEVSTQQDYQQKTYYSRPQHQQQVDIDITAPDINIGDIILKKDANSAIETAINSVISSLVWKGVGAGLGKLKDYIKSKSSIGEHNAFKLVDLETPKLQQQLKPEGKDALQKDLQKLKSPLDTIKQFGEELNNSQLKSIGDSGLKAIDGINQTMDLLENIQGAAELMNKVPQLVDQVKKYTKIGQKMMTILDEFSAPKEGDPSIIHEAKRLLDTIEGQAEYLDKIKPYSEKAAKLLTDINNVQESIKSQYTRFKNIFKPKITTSQLQSARLNDLQKIATYDLYSTTGKEYFNNIETIQNSTKSLQELVNENKTQSLKKNIENLNTIYKALPEYSKTLKDFNDNPGEFVKHRAEQLLSYDPKFNESQLKNDLQRDLTVNNTFYKYFHDNNIKTEYNGTKIDFSKMSKQQVDDIIQKHYSTKPKTNDLLLQQEIFEDQYQFNPEFRQNVSKNYTQYNPLQKYTTNKNKQLKQATSPMSLLKNADLIDYPLEQTAQTLNNYHRAYPLQTVNKYIDSLRDYPKKSKEYRLPDIQREQQQAQKIINQMPNIQENPYFKKYQLNDNLIQQRINQLEKNIKIPIQDEFQPIPKNMYNKYMSQVEDYNNPKNPLYFKEPQKLDGGYRHTARTNAEINDYKKIHYDPIYQFEQLTKEPIENVDFEDANNRIRDENIRIQEMSKQLSENKQELSGLKKYQQDVAKYNKSKKYQNLFKNPDYLKSELYYQQLMDLYSGKRYLHTKPTFSNANQLDSEENHKFILDYMTKGQVNPGTLETTTFQKGGKIIPANEELTNKLQNLYKTTANKLSSSKSIDFQNIIDNYNKQYADIIDKHLLDYPIGNNRIIAEQTIDEFNRQHPTARLSDISKQATPQDFVKYKQLKPKERKQAQRQINSQHQEEINRGQKLNHEKLYNEDLQKQADDINQKMTETRLNTESLEEFKTYAQNRHIQQNFIKNIPTSNNQILQTLKNTQEFKEPITKIQQQQRQGLLNAEIQGDKYYPSFNKTFKFNPKDNTPENLVLQHLKDSLSDYGLAGNSKDITSLIKQLPEEDQQKFFTQNKDIIDNIDIRTENNKELQDLKKYQYKQYGYKPDDYEYIRRQLTNKFLEKYATQENINKTVESLKQLIQ